MSQKFNLQQKKFQKVFKPFNFDELMGFGGYKCDPNRGQEFSEIINRESIEFLSIIFCDALLNSSLWSRSSTLMRVLQRHHFTYNNYNVFEPSCNITNRIPQYFFWFWKGNRSSIYSEKIYSTVKMYFIKFFPDLELSLGTQEARLLYISLLTDNDLNSNHFAKEKERL